jgi:hypothetical protein
MGDSFKAVPSAMAQMGSQFIQEGAGLGQAASSFGGDIFEISNAFGLLGACDGAMEKYMSMAHNTVQGLEQLAQLWEASGEQLIGQAEVYQAVEEEQQERFHGIRQRTSGSGGTR